MFSVIVPTYRRRDGLFACLRALQQGIEQTAALSSNCTIEVIVSDDAADPVLRAELESAYPWVRYLVGPARGPAANRNYGASLAKGQWLAFIDDDCVPAKEWVEAFMKQTDNGDVLEGRTIADRPLERLDEESPVNEYGGFLWSCNFAIRKDIFDDLRGFDEGFPYPAMEDVDLHTRIQKGHYKISFIPEALVVHPWRPAREISFLSKQRDSGFYYWRKHPDKKPKSLASYYGYRAIRSFVKITLPGIVSFRGRGAFYSIARDIWLLAQAFKYFFAKRVR